MRLILLIIIFSFHFPFHIYSQWVLQQTGTSEPIRDIEFINRYTGWACGDLGVILKTTNGGTNWVMQQNKAMDKVLLGIHPIDSNVVYCVGQFETLLKTTNGGTNWIALQNGPWGMGRSYYSVFFVNVNTGWIGSTGFKIMRTTNGGINFTDSPTNATVRDLYFKDGLNGIGVSEVAIVSKTSNGGINWSVSQIPSGWGDLLRISILNNSDTGIVIADGPNIVYKTTNFGNNWDSIGYLPEPEPQYEIYCSEFINDSVGWVGGRFGYLFKTKDGGKSWVRQNAENIYFINSIYAYNDSIAWTCGNFGRIYNTINGGTFISKITNNIPEKFMLYQNYPNPFNSKTIIKFDIRKKGTYKLEIYDMLGRLIETGFNEQINEGTFKYSFNSEKLTSGIYLYRLSSNEFSKTKPMIYIK